jgi:hypothetical protein
MGKKNTLCISFIVVLFVICIILPAIAVEGDTSSPPNQGAIPKLPAAATLSGKISPTKSPLINNIVDLKFELVRIRQYPTDCRCEYEVSIRNAGKVAYKGDIGVSPMFLYMGEKISGGSNSYHLDLAAGASTTEIRPLTLVGCDPKFKQLEITFRSDNKILNSQTINLTQVYSGNLLEVKEESGKIYATVRNTSSVATKFFVQYRKANPNNPGNWQPAGGINFDCVPAGGTLTLSSPVPAGWPTNPDNIKVLLKIGPTEVEEKILRAKTN